MEHRASPLNWTHPFSRPSPFPPYAVFPALKELMPRLPETGFVSSTNILILLNS
jgi:hypothetical protein